MQIQFKIQQYQTDAVNAVINVFNGQHYLNNDLNSDLNTNTNLINDYKNNTNKITLNNDAILNNIKTIQQQNNLFVSDTLIKNNACNINLDIEMETGTGKTYCYIKTIYELNKQYNFNNFIIVVPNIAIREGVLKNLQITYNHFYLTYKKNITYFSYQSSNLNTIKNFTNNINDINVMIINMQAFNKKESNILHAENENFYEGTPINLIAQTKPILILDEPQKMEGTKTENALKDFNPLFILRYSATLKTSYNKIYQLDALDAFNQKLVKKINVCAIKPNNLLGISAYLHVKQIVLSNTKKPTAIIELEQLQKAGIKRISKTIKAGDNLEQISKLDAYKNLIVTDIDDAKISLNNGKSLKLGTIIGNLTENDIRTIQISETIKLHLAKEWQLFNQSIKVLSLFFIDLVKKYRDYEAQNNQGIYAQIFEQQYQTQQQNFLADLAQKINDIKDLDLQNSEQLKFNNFKKYLSNITAQNTHSGYFSIDKKSNNFIDGEINKRGSNQGLSNDVHAYNLILKDKERLLSLKEPVRFIFSHSALREGWDNPNIFNICTLKQSDNNTSRHQEIGRGLRLCVNNEGIRQDNAQTVHQINELTIIANESYDDFAKGLQQDLISTLKNRPTKVNIEFLLGRCLVNQNGEQKIIDADFAVRLIERLEGDCGYINEDGTLTAKYHQDKQNNNLQDFLTAKLNQFKTSIYQLLDLIDNSEQFPAIGNTYKTVVENKLNDANWQKFKQLWHKINYGAIYTVTFNSANFIKTVASKLNTELPKQINPLSYKLEYAAQEQQLTNNKLHNNNLFKIYKNSIIYNNLDLTNANLKLDLIGKIAQQTNLTRKTIVQILQQIDDITFALYSQNPMQFIMQTTQIINDNKANIIAQKITYHLDKNTKFNDEIITNIENISYKELNNKNIVKHLTKHIYPHLICDSAIEHEFALDVDKSDVITCKDGQTKIKVFAKLPRTFKIPTPFGSYSPDWAILLEYCLNDNNCKQLYFIAETKGSNNDNNLSILETHKINCAKLFLDALNELEQHNLNFAKTSNFNLKPH